ncbi:hypothetical protein R1sor_022771 [Riccia sorocarpa]|uniref:SAM domain-containing protein n=1 Tax=Riccia sorocarpa TaxID=122646 RepID=A0ABD3GKT5_9MARC
MSTSNNSTVIELVSSPPAVTGVEDTARWLEHFLQCADYTELILDQKIDGASLPLLAESLSMLAEFGFKYGPRLRLYQYFQKKREKRGSSPQLDEFQTSTQPAADVPKGAEEHPSPDNEDGAHDVNEERAQEENTGAPARLPPDGTDSEIDGDDEEIERSTELLQELDDSVSNDDEAEGGSTEPFHSEEDFMDALTRARPRPPSKATANRNGRETSSPVDSSPASRSLSSKSTPVSQSQKNSMPDPPDSEEDFIAALTRARPRPRSKAAEATANRKGRETSSPVDSSPATRSLSNKSTPASQHMPSTPSSPITRASSQKTIPTRLPQKNSMADPPEKGVPSSPSSPMTRSFKQKSMAAKLSKKNSMPDPPENAELSKLASKGVPSSPSSPMTRSSKQKSMAAKLTESHVVADLADKVDLSTLAFKDIKKLLSEESYSTIALVVMGCKTKAALSGKIGKYMSDTSSLSGRKTPSKTLNEKLQVVVDDALRRDLICLQGTAAKREGLLVIERAHVKLTAHLAF